MTEQEYQARIRELEDEVDALRNLVMKLAERVYLASEVLSKVAERKDVRSRASGSDH